MIMVENIYKIDGRHLTEEEVIYVITERCKNLNIEIISVENPKSVKSSYIKLICSNCKEETVRTSNAILKYKTTECKSCSNSRKQGRFKKASITKDSLQKIIDEKYQDRDIRFKIIEDFYYQNNKQIIKIECAMCKEISDSRIDVLKQGRKSCKCSQIRSKLEAEVVKILKKNNFDFEKEYSFDNLRYIQPLRYDFCIIKEDKLFLIECDGIQHFYPTFGKESFERTKITDEIKSNYAKENNIPLLRIPYNIKESIEKVILNFINS